MVLGSIRCYPNPNRLIALTNLKDISKDRFSHFSCVILLMQHRKTIFKNLKGKLLERVGPPNIRGYELRFVDKAVSLSPFNQGYGCLVAVAAR